MDHCIETLCANTSSSSSAAAGGQNTDTDTSKEVARQALGKLVPGLLRTKANRGDLAARLTCQLGSVDAMAACTGGVQLGASHGIGHQLGPLGVGHGETSCVLLPAVCKFNLFYGDGTNRVRQEGVRRFLVLDPVVRGLLDARKVDVATADLGDVLEAVIRELGLPRSLSDVGVGREQLDGLAEHSLHDRWCQSNPVPLREKAQVLEILERVVE